MKPDESYYINEPLPESPGPDNAAEPWTAPKVVGGRRSRVDAYERTSGTAVYPSDVILPDMLYAAILRCPHPHAQVRKLDASRAEKMHGVRVILSGSSPEANVSWSYGRGVSTKLFDPHCRFEGEAVAAVAAETPYQAWDAAKAIEVEYEVLPFLADEARALAAGATPVHEGGNRVGAPAKYERGDIARGFTEADKILEEEYSTSAEIHSPMEMHGCVARWDGDRLTLWASTQGVYPVQQRVAATLGMPLANVRVIGHYMGGGFGAKLGADKYNIIAALLARKAARPVKLFLTREECCLCVGNRPPCHMKLKAGVKKDGTLTALDYTCLATGGAYPASGTSLVDWPLRDLYTCPNVRTEATDVFIHAGPARPFRAPGHPQNAWALEIMMDSLAEAVGMDPVQFRLKNIPTVSQARNNMPYTTTGLAECLREGARAFGWEEARRKPRAQGHIRRGVGVAAGMWVAGGGGPPATVIVKLFADGSANLNLGASDIGTGTKTVMSMVVAEELGVPLERIQVEHADTGTTQYASASGGSKTVPTESPAVRDAALTVRKQLLELAAQELKLEAADLTLEGGEVVSRSDAARRRKISELRSLQSRGLIVGVGYRGPNPADKVTNPFAAQFCEVEVNTRTGEVRVLRFLAAQDSGRVMNRLTFDNQAIGGITMGIGLGMIEERILDRSRTGKMVNANWHDYKIPTALDVPSEIVCLPIEHPDDQANSTGAKGLGEPVTIPTAPAIANAVYHATGIRVRHTGINPVQLSRLLAARAKED